MGRRRSLDHEHIVQDYLAGLSPKEVADKHGCHPDYVGLIVRKSGKARRPGRPRKEYYCLDCGSTNIGVRIV